MSLFVGLDWAKDKHAVCVIDQDGRVRSRLEAAHTAAGLEELLGQLRRLARASELPIAIERPGVFYLIVETSDTFSATPFVAVR